MKTITESQLSRWLELDERKSELEREARQLGKERDMITTELKAALEALGRDEVKRGRYRVWLENGRPTVAWKEEYVRELGAERAAAIVAAAPVGQRLCVEEAA